MKYKQICGMHDWQKRRGSEPTFEEFIAYLCKRQSINWREAVGQIPNFVEYVDYVDHTLRPEWAELGEEMPSFYAFVGFQLGIKVSHTKTVREERRQVPLAQR